MITTLYQLEFEKNAIREVIYDRIKEYGIKNFADRYDHNKSFISSIITGNRSTTFETLIEIYEQTQELFSNRIVK